MDKLIEYYDMIITDGNDPFYDNDTLREYMNKWDGEAFIRAMRLDKSRAVLEIGVGTGRIAARVAPLCKILYGIDVSSKTVAQARLNLSYYKNIELICADFMQYTFGSTFDVIYSTLTFMHIKEKEKCINKICSLLNKGGRVVLSLDKNTSKYLEYGEYKIDIYPDTPDEIKRYLLNCGLDDLDYIETEFAYILTATRP
ncbi:MAG: class I SAM-dependent methyltransferase [Clostridiales bacterium]|nr:class I SAM-dependent methyltransferase [Clostridiales bacterium]